MTHVYTPAHQQQLHPATPTGPYDCQAYSAAMAIDRQTLGGVVVTGRSVRLASDEPQPDPHSPGLSIPQVIGVAHRWHVELVDRRDAPWSAVLAALHAHRGVILDGDYDQIPDEFSGQPSFRGDHAVYCNHIANDEASIWEMDPLRPAGQYVPVAVLRAYAEKLGRRVGSHGVLFAQTRITPQLP